MKDRPILFSAPMVLAILEGRKTMTRRVVDSDYAQYETDGVLGYEDADGDHHNTVDLYKYGRPGDRLWVRETWAAWDGLDEESEETDLPVSELRDWGITQAHISYRADPQTKADKWRPSIFMPRWASRITLDVTAVRVERVQDISEEDASAEGVQCLLPASFSCKRAFTGLWDSINGKRPGCAWADNPWVWVVSFKRVAQ